MQKKEQEIETRKREMFSVITRHILISFTTCNTVIDYAKKQHNNNDHLLFANNTVTLRNKGIKGCVVQSHRYLLRILKNLLISRTVCEDKQH